MGSYQRLILFNFRYIDACFSFEWFCLLNSGISVGRLRNRSTRPNASFFYFGILILDVALSDFFLIISIISEQQSVRGRHHRNGQTRPKLVFCATVYWYSVCHEDDFGRWRRFFGLTKLACVPKKQRTKCLDKKNNRLHRPKTSPSLRVLGPVISFGNTLQAVRAKYFKIK